MTDDDWCHYCGADIPPRDGEGTCEACAVPCAFCELIAGRSPVFIHRFEERADYVSFEPLNPVTPGHTLVVPRRHVPDAGYDWMLTGRMFEAACATANNIPGVADYNLIVNKGAAAGQTVRHLHIHIVPRRAGDNLAMPWSNPPLVELQDRLDDEAAWGGSDDW